MKKSMLKICATAGIVVALVFVIVLLTTVFGGIAPEEFDNALVKGLFIALGIVFLLLSAVVLSFIFINDELVKEVILRTDKDGNTKTTVGVIRKITKKTVATAEGVKCKKCTIVVNEFGARLKVIISVRDKNAIEVEDYVRLLLEDAFWGSLHFKFFGIELKIKTLKPKHTADNAKAAALAKEKQVERLAAEDASAEKFFGDNFVTASQEEPVLNLDGTDNAAEESVSVEINTVEKTATLVENALFESTETDKENSEKQDSSEK